MHTEGSDFTYLSVDGVQNCIAALKEIEAGTFHHCFIEMNACEGACVNGPGIRHHHASVLRGESKVLQFAGEADHVLDMPQSEELQKHMPYIGTARCRAKRPFGIFLPKWAKQRRNKS